MLLRQQKLLGDVARAGRGRWRWVWIASEMRSGLRSTPRLKARIQQCFVITVLSISYI